MDTRRPLRWLRAWSFQRLRGAAQLAKGLDGTRAAVLMYHRVLPRPDAQRLNVEPGMYVTPQTFSRHLDWLRSEYQVLSLDEIVERIAAGRSLPRGACAITFDDGWRDNHDHALPALSARGLPATVFVVTERVGTPGAFWPDEVSRTLSALGSGPAAELARRMGAEPTGDPLQAILAYLKALPQPRLESALDLLRSSAPKLDEPERELLTWEELATLQRSGIAVESHAATHAILTALGPADVERELSASRKALLDHGLGRYGLLAYPSGCSDPSVKALARQVGYRAAFSTAHGLASARNDPMELPRVGLHDDVSRTRCEFGYALATAAHEPGVLAEGVAA